MRVRHSNSKKQLQILQLFFNMDYFIADDFIFLNDDCAVLAPQLMIHASSFSLSFSLAVPTSRAEA